MAKTHTFPQTGDNDDAENFAQMIGQHHLADYVETGMNFTVDYTVPEVTISTGLCFIRLSSDTSSSTGETRLSPNHAVQVEQDTIALADSATNHIFVEPDFQTDDNASYASYTNTANAAANALKIGEVETANNTSSTTNRSPDATFWNVDVDGELVINDRSEISFGTDEHVSTGYNVVNDWLEFTHEASGDDILRLRSDGSHDVWIPNGKLTVDAGGDGTALDVKGGDVTGIDDIRFTPGSNANIYLPDSDNARIDIIDPFNNNNSFIAFPEGGPVKIPDYDFQVNGRGVPSRMVSVPFTEIPDGYRAIGLQFRVPSSKTLRIYEAGVQNANNNAPNGLTVRAWDMTNSTEIGGTGSLHKEGYPIASKSGAIDVRVEVVNTTGGQQNASGYLLLWMEEPDNIS